MVLIKDNIGVISAQSITKTMRSMVCSIAIVPDDFLNGNVTYDGLSFFTGLNMLDQDLSHFDGNLSTINTMLTNFQPSNANMVAADTDGNALMTAVKNVDGNTGSGMTTLSYGAPIS